MRSPPTVPVWIRPSASPALHMASTLSAASGYVLTARSEGFSDERTHQSNHCRDNHCSQGRGARFAGCPDHGQMPSRARSGPGTLTWPRRRSIPAAGPPSTRPGPGCSLQQNSLAERGIPAAGQLAGHADSVPRAFRDRLAKASGERGSRPWRGAACTTKRSRWRRAL